MPNQRAIASELGLAQATVSRALQGSPLVNPETRELVREAAERLGYRPNPVVSTLMEHIRTGREVSSQGCIAILAPASNKEEWLWHEVFQHHYEGFQTQAALRGYRTECFHLEAPGVSAAQIDRVFHARGIRGVILSSVGSPEIIRQMDWSRYATAKIGDSSPYPEVDSASSSHFQNLAKAFIETASRGYERIGLCLPRGPKGQKANSQWLASYLVQQYELPQAQQIPPFLGAPRSAPLKEFRKWYDRWRPDALLCLWGEEWEWITAMGISTDDEMAFVCVNRPTRSIFAGVEENNIIVGAMTCELVVNQLVHNEAGLPRHPRQIFVEGTWVDGKTLPAHKPKTHKARRARKTATKKSAASEP